MFFDNASWIINSQKCSSTIFGAVVMFMNQEIQCHLRACAAHQNMQRVSDVFESGDTS